MLTFRSRLTTTTTRWKADTPYAGGIWEIDIVFPTEYPFKAPKVKFKTQIYHPNIKKDTGEICADVIINSWAPTLNVRYVMNTIKALVKEPNTETPLEPEIAELYTTDREKFNAEAKAHAAQFAGAS